MRLCLFTENYLKGGLDTFIVNLLKNLPDDVVITLVCNNNHSNLLYLEDVLSDRVEIIKYEFFTNIVIKYLYDAKEIKILGLVYKYIEYFLRFTILTPYYIYMLRRFFINNKFDSLLVVNGGYPGGILARCACLAYTLSGSRGNIVLNIHNDCVKSKKLIYFYECLMDYFISRSVDHLVFPSKSCEDTKKNRPRLCKIPSKVIYNGIEIVDNLKLKKRQKLFKNLVMVGTFEKRKGHLHFFDCIKCLVDKHPELTVCVYGEGTNSETETLLLKIRELQLEDVIFLKGYEQNILHVLANASALIVPSQEMESFGLVIIEAMSVGAVTICTNVGGMTEVLEGTEAGMIVDKNNKEELISAIDKVLSNPELAYAMGQNGVKIQRERFASKIMASQYLKILMGKNDEEK